MDRILLGNVKGPKGDEGSSAYGLAVRNGYTGTEAEWLESLHGRKGDSGESAYMVAVRGGFSGTEAEWLESLKGAPGDPGKPGPAGSYDILETIDEVMANTEPGKMVDALAVKEVCQSVSDGNASDSGGNKALVKTVKLNINKTSSTHWIYGSIEFDSTEFRDDVAKHIVMTVIVNDQNGTQCRRSVDFGCIDPYSFFAYCKDQIDLVATVNVNENVLVEKIRIGYKNSQSYDSNTGKRTYKMQLLTTSYIGIGTSYTLKSVYLQLSLYDVQT